MFTFHLHPLLSQVWFHNKDLVHTQLRRTPVSGKPSSPADVKVLRESSTFRGWKCARLLPRGEARPCRERLVGVKRLPSGRVRTRSQKAPSASSRVAAAHPARIRLRHLSAHNGKDPPPGPRRAEDPPTTLNSPMNSSRALGGQGKSSLLRCVSCYPNCCGG